MKINDFGVQSLYAELFGKCEILPLNEPKILGFMVDRRSKNPCVPGSIPGGTTSKTIAQQGFFDL
ncbi:MAG TPA: hypothetical protein VK835_08635 [Bacteroidia bacterium]|nr:hypothetical protein [Bacteroidia bacterium]